MRSTARPNRSTRQADDRGAPRTRPAAALITAPWAADLSRPAPFLSPELPGRNFRAYLPYKTPSARGTASTHYPDLQEHQAPTGVDGAAYRSPLRTWRAAETTVDLGFAWWQVLGSNQRRLSRRFYRHL